MNALQLLRVGEVPSGLLARLCGPLESIFGVPCEIRPEVLQPDAAFHPERGQYHSTRILAEMRGLIGARTWRLAGVSAADLYIPILTFVFGEAQVGDTCAVVSFHRLRQEFYGLPPDSLLLEERLLKETVHELGHTFDLTHCEDYHCVMAASHAVEWIDIKSSEFCPACRERVSVRLDGLNRTTW